MDNYYYVEFSLLICFAHINMKTRRRGRFRKLTPSARPTLGISALSPWACRGWPTLTTSALAARPTLSISALATRPPTGQRLRGSPNTPAGMCMGFVDPTSFSASSASDCHLNQRRRKRRRKRGKRRKRGRKRSYPDGLLVVSFYLLVLSFDLLVISFDLLQDTLSDGSSIHHARQYSHPH